MAALDQPQRGAYRIQWPGEQGIEYHLPHGAWIDLLRGSGFEIERLIELFAPNDAEKHEYYDYVTPEWASKWPHEEVWVARARSDLVSVDGPRPGRPGLRRRR